MRADGGDPRIFYGDTTGAVVHLKCRPPDPHTARPLCSKDYEVLHQDHSDWVTQVPPPQLCCADSLAHGKP